jgi:hypothetical protein
MKAWVDCYWSAGLESEPDLSRIRSGRARFTPAALAVGFSSVDAVPIQVRGRTSAPFAARGGVGVDEAGDRIHH